MNIFQITAISGILSPIIYTAAWILGGIIREDYNHIEKDISSLYAIDAPHRKLFQTLFLLSSVLLLFFYLGLHEGINDDSTDILAPVLFILSGILAVIVALFFPLDAGGEIKTYRGKMHLILIVISGILTIGGMVALWLRLETVADWSGFAFFSLVSAIISLITVIFSGIYAGSKYMGIVERIMVTPYELYYLVLSLMVFIQY